jgi:hypothetical protein
MNKKNRLARPQKRPPQFEHPVRGFHGLEGGEEALVLAFAAGNLALAKPAEAPRFPLIGGRIAFPSVVGRIPAAGTGAGILKPPQREPQPSPWLSAGRVTVAGQHIATALRLARNLCGSRIGAAEAVIHD